MRIRFHWEMEMFPVSELIEEWPVVPREGELVGLPIALPAGHVLGFTFRVLAVTYRRGLAADLLAEVLVQPISVEPTFEPTSTAAPKVRETHHRYTVEFPQGRCDAVIVDSSAHPIRYATRLEVYDKNRRWCIIGKSVEPHGTVSDAQDRIKRLLAGDWKRFEKELCLNQT